MKAKTKLIIGIVLAVVILAVGLTVTLVVTDNLERDQQQVVRSASQIETAMSTDLGGKTIVLAEDITVEGDLEMSRLADLDLNGHTLTVTGTFSVESDSAAEIEIKSTDGDKAVSGGTIDAGSVDINVPKAHVEWSADVRLGSDGTFSVLTSGDSFIFTGRFLSSGTAAASEPTITALGGRVDISSQTADVDYKVNIPSTASDVRVDSGVPSTSSVEVVTSKSVTVSGTVAVTVSEGASGVAITADSGSSLTVTGSAASVNAPSSSVTVAENSTVGSITAGDVTNNGTVSGSITASGDVTNVGSVGSVNASGNVTNTGTVSGDVTAGGTLDNGNGATIGGDVSAGTVTGDTSGIGGDVEITDITEIAVPELSATSFVYDGQVKTVSVAENAAYTVTGDTSATNAGSYTVTVTLNDPVNTKWADDYANAARTFAWTIEKATVSGITFEDATIPYDGNAHSLQIGGTLPSGVTVSYSANSHTAVGTYTVTASFDVGSNYNAIPDMTATLTITRGTIDVGTAEELTDALSDSGYSTIRLTADIEYTNLAAFNTAVQAANGSLTIDLNDNTLTLAGTGTITAQNGFSLTITNGELVANNNTYTDTCFSAETDSSVTFEDLTVTSTGSVLFPRGDAAEVNIINCDITTTGVYVVGTNAGSEENYGVVINISGSTLTAERSDGDTCVVMINVAGELNISDTEIYGQRQGVMVRAGTATLTNVDITVDLKCTFGTDRDTRPFAATTDGGWNTGNEVSYGALVVGNNTASTYNANAVVTMTGGSLTCTTTIDELKNHTNAIYALRIGGSNNTTSVTLSGTTVSGQVINYNNTATITGLPADMTVITALVSRADELEKALVNNAYIVLVDDIKADVVIPEDTTVTLDLNGYTLTNESDHTIINNGTLTVVDSSEEKTGVVDNITHAKAALYNEVGATATLNGGEFTRSEENGSSSTESGGNSYYAILNHGTMTINAGTKITQDGHYSSLIDNGWFYPEQNTTKTPSKLIITGGVFDGGLNTIKNDDWGVLDISGGTFSNVTQDVIMNYNTVTISGGVFDASESNYFVIENINLNTESSCGKITITGGKFIGAICATEGSTFEISGNPDFSEVTQIYVYSSEQAEMFADYSDGVTVIAYTRTAEDFKAFIADSNIDYLFVISNFELAEVVEITRDVTININSGVTITIPSSLDESCVVLRVNSGTLTLIGSGTIDATAAGDKVVPVAAMGTKGANEEIIATGNVIISNITIKVDTAYESCVYAMYGGIVTINGGTFINECTDEYAYGGGAPLTLNVSNSAQVTDIVVYGGTFQGRNPALGDDNLGGNFVADGYKVVERTYGTYEVVAEGAEVTGDDIAVVYYYNNGVASKAEVYTAAGFTNAFGGGYSDILLMSDFSLGETVTVEAGESVTLDFNGKSVTYTGTEGLRPIQNYGTLTVLNTEGNLIAEGQGGMECINATVYGVFDCLAGSTTYIYGGYYETNGSDNAAVLRIREGAEATVYDGSFVCTSYDAAVSSDGKLTIYDGYYYTDSSNRGNWNYCVKSNGEFYMYGGTVIGVQGGIAIFGGSGEIYDCDVTVRDNVYEAAGDTSDRSFYALYVAGEATEVTCLVEGGTFNAHYRYAAYIGNSNAGGDGGLMLDARVQINGGTFIGEMGAIHVDGTLGTAIIRGGSFNTDVNEYVVDGKVCVQNAETEMYDVVSSDYVIETAQDFLDLQQFNSAILAGKSLNVTLANDIDLNDIDMSDAYSSDILVSHFAGTFNGNGHTIKSNGVPYIFGFALNSAEFKNVTIEFNDTEITRLVYRAEYTAIGRSGNTFYVEDDSELVLTYDNVDYAPSSTNEEYYYDFGSVGNSALYYNNNCTLAYAYYDGSDIDTYADSAYYNTDRTTVLPFKITIKNCDVSANFRGAEHGSGAAIFLGGQIYGTYVDIDTCSYSGDFVGEYAGIIFANESGVSRFLDGDGNWTESFVTGGITYTSHISISDVSLTGTLSTLNGGLTFGNNVTEGVGSSTAESGELTKMTADSSLGISQNESGNYVITGASTDDGTYSYSLRLMMGTVNWYYDADYTNYYGETSNFTITIALDVDETPIELGYSEATPLALSQANKIVASDFSAWDGTSEEGYRYAFVESGDSHYVIIDFQGQYDGAYRQFDSDSGTTTAKIYAFDSLDRFVATATEA